MTAQDNTHEQYALGRSSQEYGRLARQAQLMKPAMQRLFTDAGIGPGMRVLDLGSGAGDVAMLAAEMVGPSGSVVGVDLDAQAIAHARQRIAASRFSNISFAVSDFSQFQPTEAFDAIVGRFVLMYQPDPVTALKSMVTHLRPGGRVAFIEPWFQVPPGPESMLKTAVTIITETLRRTGAHIDLGPRLHKVFAGAGLPTPAMRFEAIMDGHEDSVLFQYMADTVASLLPRAMEHNVPGAAGLDVRTIPDRVRQELGAVGYAAVAAPFVAAWCAKAK